MEDDLVLVDHRTPKVGSRTQRTNCSANSMCVPQYRWHRPRSLLDIPERLAVNHLSLIRRISAHQGAHLLSTLYKQNCSKQVRPLVEEISRKRHKWITMNLSGIPCNDLGLSHLWRVCGEVLYNSHYISASR